MCYLRVLSVFIAGKLGSTISINGLAENPIIIQTDPKDIVSKWTRQEYLARFLTNRKEVEVN